MYFAGIKSPVGTGSSSELTDEPEKPQNATEISDDVPPDRPSSDSAVSGDKTSEVLSETSISDYVRAIFDPADTTFPRLECRRPDTAALQRYAAMLNDEIAASSEVVKFFFALDLTQCVELLPRLIGSIIEAIRFLGPENCALSIVEGNSDDGTPKVLAALRTHVEAMGTEYFFETSSVNPKAGERIEGLAALRNLALQPMLDDRRRYSEKETTIIFLNDVAACMEDILELAYQRVYLEADMTCAMDWTYLGRDPTFYDVWISRTISGDSFFNIPEDGSWDSVSHPGPSFAAQPPQVLDTDFHPRLGTSSGRTPTPRAVGVPIFHSKYSVVGTVLSPFQPNPSSPMMLLSEAATQESVTRASRNFSARTCGPRAMAKLQ